MQNEKCIMESEFSCRGVQLNAPTEEKQVQSNQEINYYSLISPKKKTLAIIIRTFKGTVTTWCRNNGFECFRWQRNYFEHIIRGEIQLNAIREYIRDNPVNWEMDEENI
jgi:REP element-mobilizing transposase RayT